MLRVIVLLNAVALNFYHAANFAHPGAGIAATLVMVGWTAVAIWGYAEPVRRTPPLLVVDLAMAITLLLLSPLIKGAAMQATVPGFWVMGALLAWAVHWRWIGGLIAGVLLGVADLAVRETLTQANYGNLFLILVGGPIVGFMCASLARMADERDVAERAAAAATERARLARAVHDGVLQVLALVQRRGSELGGEAAELGRLAGEQEAALRALIRRQDSVITPAPVGGSPERDLTDALSRLEAVRPVTLAAPAEAVVLRGEVVDELVAVVGACLDNVATHVGPDAPAWVLLEAFTDRVELSVRDEGPGIASGRLDEALREGRLGVSESIRGRVVELGGTATLHTGSYGTEWEIVVPR